MNKLALKDQLGIDVEDIQFENDLDEPIIGALIKDPTALGFSYGVGALALCFVPGFGLISAGALVVMGCFDIKATIAADGAAPKTLSLGPAHLDDSEPAPQYETMRSRKALPAAEPVEQPTAPAPTYDPAEYTEPSPWGPSRTPALPSATGKPDFMNYTPEQESLLGANAEQAVELRVQDALRDRVIPSDTAKQAVDSNVAACLARMMVTPDDSGYLRSWFIAAITRTGKGAALLAAMLTAADSGLQINFWAIEPKNDPGERYRWSAIPADRRLHFEAAHPGTEAADVARQIKDLTLRFYDAKQGINILIVDELKVLMDCLGRAGKEHQAQFSSFLSGVAATGASRQRYIWTTTTAIGIGDNGLNGRGDRESFVEAYLVTKNSKNKVTSHRSYDLATVVPDSVLAESGRAFITSQDNEWHPVPLKYKALDDTLKNSQPEPLAAPPAKVIEPTDQECQDLADVLISVVTSQRAIALSLEQIAVHHPGVKHMLNSDDYRLVLDATVRKAGDLGMLRVIEISGMLSVGAVREKKQRA